MTKDVIRCEDCALCAAYLPAGFVSQEEYYCSNFQCEVTPDDGCTFGLEGENKRAVCDYEIVLGADCGCAEIMIPEEEECGL